MLTTSKSNRANTGLIGAIKHVFDKKLTIPTFSSLKTHITVFVIAAGVSFHISRGKKKFSIGARAGSVLDFSFEIFVNVHLRTSREFLSVTFFPILTFSVPRGRQRDRSFDVEKCKPRLAAQETLFLSSVTAGYFSSMLLFRWLSPSRCANYRQSNNTRYDPIVKKSPWHSVICLLVSFVHGVSISSISVIRDMKFHIETIFRV